MIDGVSGAQVLEVMADPAPHDPPLASPPPAPSRSLFDSLRPIVLLGAARDAAQAFGILGSLVLESVPTLPFNGPITDARRIVWASFALNSDDPAYFGGYLTDNYFAASQALGLGRDDVHRLATNAFEASFVGDEEKRALLRELDDYLGGVKPALTPRLRPAP